MKYSGIKVWPALGLVSLVLIAYANSFTCDFTIDSRAIILGDPRLQGLSLDNLRMILGEDYWWPTASSNLYRPISTLSFWFNYSVLGHGNRPLGYHVINVALHLINVLLLWRIIRRLSPERSVAWLAAALFAVHPLGVESVTNLVGRADLLATMGILATAVAWLRASETSERKVARRWRIIAAVMAVSAVSSKENGVMVVAAIGLLEIRGHGWRQGLAIMIRQGLPMLAPALVVLAASRIWVFWNQAPAVQTFTSNPITGAGFWQGFMTAVGVLSRYLGLLIWPASLSCDYSYPQIPLFGNGGWEDIRAWFSLGGIGVIAVVAYRLRTRWPLLGFGLTWGAIMLLPTSNLFIRIGSIMAERFLYLPLTGFALAIAVLLIATGSTLARKSGLQAAGIALMTLVLGALVLRTHVRNIDWRDEHNIWIAAARVCPRSFNVHLGLALSGLRDPATEGDLDAGIVHAERALELLDSPPLPVDKEDNTVLYALGKFYRGKADFCLARGETLNATRWLERSRQAMQRTVVVNKSAGSEVKRKFAERGDTVRAGLTYGNARMYLDFALANARLGRLEDAEKTLIEGRRIDPNNVELPLLLAAIARERGALDAAASRLIQVVLLENGNGRAWRELADVYSSAQVQPAPIVVQPGGGQIDTSSSLVRNHLDMALVELVQLLQLAGHPGDAQAWKEKAMREYGTRRELFTQ